MIVYNSIYHHWFQAIRAIYSWATMERLTNFARREIRTVIVWYCFLQAAAVIAWWSWLILDPSSFVYFWPESLGFVSLRLLMIGDLVTYVGLGGMVGLLAYRDSAWIKPWLWAMLGGITYATAVSVSASVLTGEGSLGAMIMGMSWLGFLHIVGAEHFSNRENLGKMFRNATDTSSLRNRMVTGMQLLVFWPLILGLFPWLIVKLQWRTPIPFFSSGEWFALGWLVFLLASVINLHTAWTMATFGAGTPFPYDKTNRLVNRGLYRWIRNPMAATGLAQGFGVGLMYGSPLVLIYVLCGGLIWQFLVRPLEEQMLTEQFGEEYCCYQRRVGLWVPKAVRESK